MAKKKQPQLPPENATEAFELLLEETGRDTYVLRLYVSGMTPNSLQAIENVRALCAKHLAGRCRLEIIDIFQQPHLAREGQIIAAPTLVKELPPPLRRFIGDMSKEERILVGLNIRKKDQE